MKYSSAVRKALRSSALAEVQAIAIYEAECFWIRDPARRALLGGILAEEMEHGRFAADWVQLGEAEQLVNRCLGWALGSTLSLLPWRQLCRVQSWAEGEASAIYSRALAVVEKDPGAKNLARLATGLREAMGSEAEHALRFRAWAAKARRP